MNTKKLKCEECGGIMEIDEDKSIICCPYCGSKEFIEYSDDVKKTKILADAEVKVKTKEIETTAVSKEKLVEHIVGGIIISIFLLGFMTAVVIYYLKM